MDSDHDNDPPELGRLRDMRALWRATTWGALAALCVGGVVLVMQTDAGAQRLQLVLASLSATADNTAARADIPPADDKETVALRLETQRLRAEVRQLASDRDRLNDRIVGLESQLNDMTGSIKRELALLAPKAPVAQTPPPTIDPPDSVPPRSPSEIAGTGGDERRSVNTGDPLDQSQAKFQRRLDLGPDTDAKPTPKAELSAKPDSPPTAVQSVPLPPVRVASAPPTEPAGQSDKAELGIELGGARSMEILHARWAAVKANFGPMIEGMHPLVVHDRRPGINIPYRLIVGPLPNGAAAAQLCQRFAAARVSCRTTRFAGDALAQR
jgi:hypothetical protein